MDTKKPFPKSNIISTPGYYECHSDISFHDKDICVLIDSPNVTLDLKGFTLRYEGTPSTSNKGILSQSNKNIHIINGHLENFYYGIISTGSKSLEINNISMKNIKYIGINAEGENLYIRNNHVLNMDFGFPKPGTEQYIIGINLQANGGMVINNKIETTLPQPHDPGSTLELVGILVGSGTIGLTILGNLLLNTVSEHKMNYAIWAGKESQAGIIGNFIKNYYYDIAGTHASNLYFSNNKTINDDTYLKFIQDNILNNLFQSSSQTEKELIKSYLDRLADNNSFDSQTAIALCPAWLKCDILRKLASEN